MELKKNSIYEIEITDMGTDGEGIGHIENGITVFVKDTVVGDIAEILIMKAKKNIAYGRLVCLIKPSPFRVDALCPVARACGGCQLQSMSYKKQLYYKTKKVRDCLERIGGFKVASTNENSCNTEADSVILYDTIGMKNPWNYRNKAQFPVGLDKSGKPVTGFYAGRSHRIIPASSCAIQFKGHEAILDAVMRYITEASETVYNEETGIGVIRHILLRKAEATGEIMVVLVINGNGLRDEKKLIEMLTPIHGMTSIQLNINKKNTNVILGDEFLVLWGQSYITDKIGEIRYQISAPSFYQVNPIQTKVLYDTALSFAELTGNETVWDLYCGIGTISLFLAQNAKQVYGVEIVSAAVENAVENAKLNNIKNARFFTGAAEDVYVREKFSADVVVVDPPRKGLDEKLITTISKTAPKKIVYVSCDPGTLARDLRRFADEGFKVVKAQPVDMFPHSCHVECVVLLSQVQRTK